MQGKVSPQTNPQFPTSNAHEVGGIAELKREYLKVKQQFHLNYDNNGIG